MISSTITCDHCGASKALGETSKLPIGWRQLDVIGEGPYETPFKHSADLCPTCVKAVMAYFKPAEKPHHEDARGILSPAPQADDEDWAEWTGGAPPVGNHAGMRIKLRNGVIYEPLSSAPLNWGHDVPGQPKEVEIIAYRPARKS